MLPEHRYEILQTIAKGDFATVYRARDNELGREVAIKQIHQQYLDDPAQLERYWQEAQLLAKLEHPYIMTIYDIVRQRGWLILELAQGSLPQKLAGNPIDLEDLRLTLTYMLHALNFMQENGIVHGDVKPSNLLLDKNHRVKLGDFGIARRMAGDDGSVVKGTTKYMAPEVVSDQFGPVGHHSDLYSLGFSAFELMCGSHFDTLFPGLNMFGRDQQIAWMMWHSAADRKLPEINRVLEGVPEDLAHVIERLCEKDPTKRFRSAAQVIELLRAQSKGEKPPSEDDEAVAELAAKQAGRKRMMTIGACAGSMLLCVAMLLFGGSAPAPENKPDSTIPSSGYINELDEERRLLIVQSEENEKPATVVFDPKLDQIVLEDRIIAFSDLRRGDQIAIQQLTGDDGSKSKKIIVTRPLEDNVRATIQAIDDDSRLINLDTTLADGEQTSAYVPFNLEVELNGSKTLGDREVRLTDLKPNDQASIAYVASGGRYEVRALSVLRRVADAGHLVSIDTENRRITLRPESPAGAPSKTWPLDESCELSLNGQTKSPAGKLIALADLRADDRLEIERTSHITKLAAYREFVHTGTVTNINHEDRLFDAQLRDPPKTVSVLAGATCKITVEGDGRVVPFEFIREGDRVTIAHDAAFLQEPVAHTITVAPAPNPGAWAVVIAQQQYDDASHAKLSHIAADAGDVRDSLVADYRVPAGQMLFELDQTRGQLEQDLPIFLERVPADAQLVVYFIGHSYVDSTEAAFLAMKDSSLDRISTSGLRLGWLVSQLERCAAKEKILLLDSCHNARGNLSAQPAAEKLVQTLQGGPTRPASSSVVIVASCSNGQRGATMADPDRGKDGKRGLFADAVAAAFAGNADQNGDDHVDTGELYSALRSHLADKQTPALFLPDANPPRLTAEAKQRITSLLNYLQVSRLDELATAEFTKAQELLPDQPDVELVYGLVMFKHSKTLDSQQAFENVAAKYPQVALAHYALAWRYFLQKKYTSGITSLEKLVASLPDPADGMYDEYTTHLLEFAGILRGYALTAADTPLQLADVAALDQAVIDRGQLAKETFGRGVSSVLSKVAALEGALAKADDAAEKASLTRERKRLSYYTTFDIDMARDAILQGLEQ